MKINEQRWRDALRASIGNRPDARLSLLTIILLSGCGVLMSHSPAPEGWPQLTERIERPGFIAVQQKCGGSMFGVVAGCAVVFLTDRTCTIYSAVSGEDEVRLLEHERLHCKGFDHLGSTALRDHLEKFRHVLVEAK